MPDTITRELKDAIKKGFSDAQQVTARHTADIIGDELGKGLEDVKKLTGAALTPLKGLIGRFTGGRDETKSDRKRNSLLKDMVDYFHRQEKAAGRQFDPKKKKGPMGVLWMAAIALAAVLGAVVGKIVLPFTLLFAALTKIKPIARGINKIGDVFTTFFRKVVSFARLTKLPAFKALKPGVLVKLFAGLYNFFAKILSPFMKVFAFAQKLGLGTLFSAFKTGFKFLAWPLQIILSVIDFIKGFVQTEGTIAQKIMGGLWEVIDGFIGLPVRLFGWIADWVLKQFGIEIEGGVGNRIMNSLKSLWDGITTAILNLGPIIGEWFNERMNSLKQRLTGVADFLAPVTAKVSSFFDDMGERISTFFNDMIQKLIGWIMKLPKWIPGVKTLQEELGGMVAEEEPTKRIDEIEKDKQRMAAEAAARRAAKEDMERKQRDKDREEQKRANDINIKTATALTNQTRQEKPVAENPPDQNDNNFISLALWE